MRYALLLALLLGCAHSSVGPDGAETWTFVQGTKIEAETSKSCTQTVKIEHKTYKMSEAFAGFLGAVVGAVSTWLAM